MLHLYILLIFFLVFLIQAKLAVDPAVFKPDDCMSEFKKVCSKFKILKGDLVRPNFVFLIS
jgi:hypothetical protein